MKSQALSGVKIIEYANLISGPFCTKLMSDLGAEVIKVERPGVGDDARKMGPFPGDMPHSERSGLFLYLNTNKTGITLNIETVTGVRIFKELIKEADVLVENYPPSFMERLELGYERLRTINPRLVMTSITPFGQTGPYRDYKSCDLVNFHLGGAGYLTPGQVSNPETERPLKGPGRQTYFIAGITSAIVTLAGLFTQRQSGFGQHLDVSEVEALATRMGQHIAIYTYEKVKSGRVNPALGAETGLIRCKDGYVHSHIADVRQWKDFINLMGNPDWGGSDLFKDRRSRVRNWEILKPLIEGWTMEHTRNEVFHLARDRRIPIAPVNTMKDLMDSDHLSTRKFFREIAHSEAGKQKYPGPPCKLSEKPVGMDSPAPRLGEHNEEVFCKRLGYSRQNLVKMRAAGII